MGLYVRSFSFFPPCLLKSRKVKQQSFWLLKVPQNRRKWSKGKLREKRNHLVVYNQSLLDKVLKEVPKKMRVITVYNLVEMYKINGSLARRTIQELLKRGTIKTVCRTAHLGIYTKAGKPSSGKGKKDKSDKKGKKRNLKIN